MLVLISHLAFDNGKYSYPKLHRCSMVGILTLEFSLKAIYLFVVAKICNASFKYGSSPNSCKIF
jgi:hypothetical protein